MGYTNSNLATNKILSPNHSGTRTHAIDRITPHCVVGQLTGPSIANCFTKGKEASCNYGIGKKGDVCLIVEEENRSWCSSSNENDQRAITIECASNKTAPYAMNDAVYGKLIELCVDICKRNGKNKLIWISDKDKALSYEPKENEMLITVHRWFANKSCPGDWLYNKLGELASAVTDDLGGNEVVLEPVVKSSYYRVRKSWEKADSQIGAYKSLANAETCADQNPGYFVFDDNGNSLYPEVSSYHPITSDFFDGQIIKLKSDATYVDGSQIPGWVFNSTIYYRGQNSNGIIFSTLSTGAITGVVKASDIIGGAAATPSFNPYIVQVTADGLNVRKGPSVNNDITSVITDKGCYTIVEESNGWGHLKSGLGWINLSYTEKV